MNKYVLVMQSGLKKSSGSLLNFLFKLLTGVVLGMTLALIFQEVFQFGNLLFLFVIVATTTAFLSIARGWSSLIVGIFNLFCILLALLLRMYALVAPGA